MFHKSFIMRYIRLLSTLLVTISLLPFNALLNAQSCYELVWSEEFNYSGLPDSTIWTQEVGASGWGNNELQYYTKNRSENARVEEGNLVIEALKENYEGASYTSARLMTYYNGHSFKYGKIEARMKLPYGQGIWPAFWMLGDGIFEGTPWPASGEIDIMEMVGGGAGRDDVVHGTIHWSDASGNHASYGGQKQLNEGILADDFHLFSIEWNETSIKWFLDGIQYHVVDITPAHMSEFHENFFIILNLAVGGNWPGYPDATTVFPQRMSVDYVRVYQLNASPKITGDSVVLAAEKGIRYSTAESGDFTYDWTVPADANIINGQGTHSILVDWGCDTGSVSCELTTLCDNYSLIHKVHLKALEISGMDHVEVDESNLTYSIPLTRESSHIWSLPVGVKNNSAVDTNSVNVDWNDADGEMGILLTNFCGTDSASKTISVVRQLPYPDPGQPHMIPGTIESVHFDTGGEGFAYHDTEAENLGPGSRQDEGVDTEPNDGSENIGWLEAGEWLEYTIDVEKTALYDVDIRLASTNNGGKFRLLFDGEERTGDVAVPQTGAWTTFTTVTLNGIQLYDADSLMRIYIVNGLFNMGRLQFSEALPIQVDDFEDSRKILIYPTLSRHHIFVKNLMSMKTYTIIDMMGRMVKTGTIVPGGHITVDDLYPGAYYLFLAGSEKFEVAGRFHRAD